MPYETGPIGSPSITAQRSAMNNAMKDGYRVHTCVGSSIIMNRPHRLSIWRLLATGIFALVKHINTPCDVLIIGPDGSESYISGDQK